MRCDTTAAGGTAAVTNKCVIV